MLKGCSINNESGQYLGQEGDTYKVQNIKTVGWLVGFKSFQPLLGYLILKSVFNR